MRLAPWMLTLALTTAALAALPAAHAATQVCTVGMTGCGGFVCVSNDTDPRWSDSECVSKTDLDRCRYQSDCCATTGFWCPERA